MSVSFDGLKLDVFKGVYEPAEDSFMLAEHSRLLEGDVLDMGTGCGIQAIAASGANVLGADINPMAVENARHNAKATRSSAKFVVSDLFGNVSGKFDCILFNPPYLPTAQEEKLRGVENLAFDGGRSGREVIDRFLWEFAGHLGKGGKLLLLVSTLSDSGESERVLDGQGFAVKELGRKHVGMLEELRLLEARKDG